MTAITVGNPNEGFLGCTLTHFSPTEPESAAGMVGSLHKGSFDSGGGAVNRRRPGEKAAKTAAKTSSGCSAGSLNAPSPARFTDPEQTVLMRAAVPRKKKLYSRLIHDPGMVLTYYSGGGLPEPKIPRTRILYY